MAQIVGEPCAQHREPHAQHHLTPPQRPEGKPGAEHDASRNQHAVKRDHAATLSSTMSVNRAGRYTMETKNRRHARPGVAPTRRPVPAATYPIPSTKAPKKYHAPDTPSTVGSRLIGSSAVA